MGLEGRRKSELLESQVEIIATLLEDHLSLIDDINRYVSFMLSLDEVKSEHIDPLNSKIEDLSSLRATIISAMARAVETLKASGERGEAAGDLYALLVYYAEAASHKELEALRRALRFLDVSRHLEEARGVYERARSLAREVEGLLD